MIGVLDDERQAHAVRITASDNSCVGEVLPQAQPALDMRTGNVRLLFNQFFCRFAICEQQILVESQVGEAQKRIAALSFAQELPGAAHLEVALGDHESVRVLVNHLQAFARHASESLFKNQDAYAVSGTA